MKAEAFLSAALLFPVGNIRFCNPAITDANYEIK